MNNEQQLNRGIVVEGRIIFLDRFELAYDEVAMQIRSRGGAFAGELCIRSIEAMARVRALSINGNQPFEIYSARQITHSDSGAENAQT